MLDHRLNPPEAPPIPNGVRIICRCGAEFETDAVAGEDRVLEAEADRWEFGYGRGLTYDTDNVICPGCGGKGFE